MIIVTGATGKLGRGIVDELLGIVPASGVGVSVRDPDGAADLAGRGVRVRSGDFDDAASLDHSFEGATQVLLVSSNARASGGDAIAQHRTAIAAARRAGVRRIVYTSHMGASAMSAFPPMLDHAATETLLADSGVAWAALRNGFYASTVPMLVGDPAETGLLEAPADGKVAWTTHGDLAAAAAQVLVQEGRFEGATPPLTADEAFDLTDVAAMLSATSGRLVERRVIKDDEQERRLAAAGLPPAVVGITMALYHASRAGEFSVTSLTLGELIGRQPVQLRDIFGRQSA